MSDLILYLSASCQQEKSYIVSVIFQEIFGLNCEVHYIASENNKIVLNNNKSIELPDTLFAIAEKNWLSERCLPVSKLETFNTEKLPFPVKVVDKQLPILFGSFCHDGEIFIQTPEKLTLGIDILGSCFFQLSRIEEVIVNGKDAHSRFAASDSIAKQTGIIDRPLVNEYIELLWSCMYYLDNRLKRKSREFSVKPTHDVDRPFAYRFKGPVSLLINLGADILVRKKLVYALKGIPRWVSVKSGNLNADPFNTFSYIMDTGEKYGRQLTFYFLANRFDERWDGEYDINDEIIVKLLREIHARGHQIGLHGSYHSYNRAALIQKEKEILLSVSAKAGVSIDNVSMRQHYLRWDSTVSFALLDQAGFASDSTLGFADHAGFRCGICYSYPVYDVFHRKPLALREQPLIMMESTVIDKQYMNMGYTEDALEYMLMLKERCKLFNGEFVLLWHNHRLVESQEKAMYEKLLE